MRIEPHQLDKLAAYRLMTSLIVPRPIAWVGTRGKNGVDNLAPFSFFNGVSTSPPIVSVSIARGRGGALKDTVRNVLATKELSVSMVSLPQLNVMHDSSAPYPPDQSEFDALDLKAIPCELIDAPRPAVSKVTMECQLHQAIDLGTTHLILARVVAFHIEEGLLQDGVVDPLVLDPIARLGGNYAQLGALHNLGRPRLR
jgi:flavin reductase (DIM6/NTAB) family NADH-FMN oxidoreductase RutF